jgi:hypothetical protein
VLTAQAINNDGSTKVSPPIVVRHERGLIFDPMLLPGGAVAFFYSLQATPNCVLRTSNFTDWNLAGRKGTPHSSTTFKPMPVRIFQVRECL